MTYSMMVGKYKLIFSDTHFKDFRKKPTISVYDADTNSETKIASFNSQETFEWFVEAVVEADRKTENSSEKPNNCETCANGEGDIEACGYCRHGELYEPKTEHSGKVTEMVEPQTEIRKDIPVICAECDHVSIHQKYLFCELSHRTVYNAKPEWCPLPKLFIADDEPKTEPQVIACPIQEEDAEYARWLYEPQTHLTEDDAFYIVYKDLTKDEGVFTGRYDVKNGSEKYMYGVCSVMEYIAYKVGEDCYDAFTDRFTKNMIESQEKAEGGEK